MGTGSRHTGGVDVLLQCTPHLVTNDCLIIIRHWNDEETKHVILENYKKKLTHPKESFFAGNFLSRAIGNIMADWGTPGSQCCPALEAH